MNLIHKTWFHALIWMVVDFSVFIAAYLLAVLFSNDFHIMYDAQGKIAFTMAFFFSWKFWAFALLQPIFFAVCRIYRKIWGYANFRDIVILCFYCAIYCLFFAIVCETVLADHKLPNGLYPIICIFDAVFLVIVRMGNQLLTMLQTNESATATIPTMIIGAGMGGRELLFNIRRSARQYRPVVFIDDDRSKHNLYLNGVLVFGGRNSIVEAVKRYRIKAIILAIPSLTTQDQRDLLDICAQTRCKLQMVPSVSEIADGKISVNQLKEVDVEDLLGREEVQINIDEIHGYLDNKCVMVSGGGGSIGSEICRQLVKFCKLKQLILLDIYENNVYDIEQELRQDHPDLQLTVLIASVRDQARLNMIFDQYHPDIVFHAAAHKHVPLMESSPFEAMKNNVLGTWNIARAAKNFNVHRFILISTDKAVWPTNVMGCSKRLCEMIIQSLCEPNQTEFAAVRFGNVLGSNGSVIPLFKKQIAMKKPLTVTHPEIVRYFMTIPEAAKLVIQAGALAKGGEIFILDMGKPFKILELAENLIKLSGLKPYEDIPIKFCGLRSGEKLYEELSLAEEGMIKSEHSKIMISNPIAFDKQKLLDFIEELPVLIERNDKKELYVTLKSIVSTFVPERAGKRFDSK